MGEHKRQVITADVVPLTAAQRQEREVRVAVRLVELNAAEEELKEFLFCNGGKYHSRSTLMQRTSCECIIDINNRMLYCWYICRVE